MTPDSSQNLSLDERKRLLVAESGEIRRAISLQLDAIQDSVGWVDKGIRVGSAVGKGASVAAALGGLFLAWKAFKKRKDGEGAESGVENEAEAEDGEKSSMGHWVEMGLQAAGLVGPLLSLFRR